MVKKHAALLLGVLAFSAFHSLSMAWADGRGGTYQLVADAFWVEEGWQHQERLLLAKQPGRAVSEITLPNGQYVFWVRFQGQIEVTVGTQSWKLREDTMSRWQRVGQVAGGRLPLAVTGSENTEFYGLVFSSVAGYSPEPEETVSQRADGLLLALDFAEVERQTCRDTAGSRTFRTSRSAERESGPWGHALRVTTAGMQIDPRPTFRSATEALTTLAWVRPEAANGYQAVLFKGQRSGGSSSIHFHFGLCDGKLEFKYTDRAGVWAGLYRGPSYPVPAVPLGQWSHLAATFDKGMIRFYVNGQEVASRKSPVERLIPNSHALYVGQGQDPGGRSAFAFSGLIDGVKLYDRAMAAAEIAADYEAGQAVHVGTVSPANKPKPPEDKVPSFAEKLKIVERYEKSLPEDTIASVKTTAAVRPHQGVPALWINDRPVAPIAMIPIEHFPREVCRDFAAAGVHVYSHILWTWARVVPESKARKLDECTDWWLGPGKYAFERVDRQVQDVYRRRSPGLHLPPSEARSARVVGERESRRAFAVRRRASRSAVLDGIGEMGGDLRADASRSDRPCRGEFVCGAYHRLSAGGRER